MTEAQTSAFLNEANLIGSSHATCCGRPDEQETHLMLPQHSTVTDGPMPVVINAAAVWMHLVHYIKQELLLGVSRLWTDSGAATESSLSKILPSAGTPFWLSSPTWRLYFTPDVRRSRLQAKSVVFGYILR